MTFARHSYEVITNGKIFPTKYYAEISMEHFMEFFDYRTLGRFYQIATVTSMSSNTTVQMKLESFYSSESGISKDRNPYTYSFLTTCLTFPILFLLLNLIKKFIITLMQKLIPLLLAKEILVFLF